MSFVFPAFLCNFAPVICFLSNFKYNFKQYTFSFGKLFG